MLEDPENNPQPGGEFDHPPIAPLDLFTHAEPMPPRQPDPVQEQPQPIPPLLPPETAAPDPRPLDPPLQSSIPATAQRETPLLPVDPYDPRTYPTSKVPPLAPMPPDPFDQKTGGVNFDLLGQFRKLQEEVAILRKQLFEVYPRRLDGASGSGGMISFSFTAVTANGYNTSTHVLTYTTTTFAVSVDLDAGTATVTPTVNSPTTFETAVSGTCT